MAHEAHLKVRLPYRTFTMRPTLLIVISLIEDERTASIAHDALLQSGVSQMGFGLSVYNYRCADIREVRNAVRKSLIRFNVERIAFEQAMVVVMSHHDTTYQVLVGEGYIPSLQCPRSQLIIDCQFEPR